MGGRDVLQLFLIFKLENKTVVEEITLKSYSKVAALGCSSGIQEYGGRSYKERGSGNESQHL